MSDRTLNLCLLLFLFAIAILYWWNLQQDRFIQKQWVEIQVLKTAGQEQAKLLYDALITKKQPINTKKTGKRKVKHGSRGKRNSRRSK